jgi:hypothetical protein
MCLPVGESRLVDLVGTCDELALTVVALKGQSLGTGRSHLL